MCLHGFPKIVRYISQTIVFRKLRSRVKRNKHSQSSMKPYYPEIRKKLYSDRYATIVGELFRCAAETTLTRFHLLPNSFELLGVDFLVDQNYNVSLLEINEGPTLPKVENTENLLTSLMSSVVKTTIKDFFLQETYCDGKLEKVLDMKLTGGKIG